MPRIEHALGCLLDPGHWLRHAIAAAGRLVSPHEGEVRHLDRLAAVSLLDTLAHLAELQDWAAVTLEDVARLADVPDTRFQSWCTCGATRPGSSLDPDGSSELPEPSEDW